MIGAHPAIFTAVLLDNQTTTLLDLARRLHNEDAMDRAVGYLRGYDRELRDLTYQSTLNKHSDLL